MGKGVRKQEMEMDEKSAKQLENVKRYVRRMLKESGKYKPEMAHQVEMVASSLLVFRRVRDEVLSDGVDVMVRESSREGDPRYKANPLFGLYVHVAGALRKDLRALKMNQELEKRTSEAEEGGDDALTALMESMEEDE